MEWKCGFEGKVYGRRKADGGGGARVTEGKGFSPTSRGSFVTVTKKREKGKRKLGKRTGDRRERVLVVGEGEEPKAARRRRTQREQQRGRVRGCLAKPRTFVAGARRWPGEQNPPPSSPPLVDPPEPEPEPEPPL